jgi:hypothetical protein
VWPITRSYEIKLPSAVLVPESCGILCRNTRMNDCVGTRYLHHDMEVKDMHIFQFI